MKSLVFLSTFVAGIIAVSGYFQGYQYQSFKQSISEKGNLNSLELAEFGSTDKFQFRAMKELQEEINKKLIMNFYKEVVNGDRTSEASYKYLDKHTYIQHNPDVSDGREAIEAIFKRVKAKSEIHHIGADGDLVYVHSKNTIFPNGETSSVVDIYKVQDKKIVEHWDVIQNYKLFANDHPFF